MTLNPPRWARVLIYVVTILGTPLMVYLRAKDIIGDLELTLWSSEVSAAGTLALLNVPASAVVTGTVISETGETGAIEATIGSEPEPQPILGKAVAGGLPPAVERPGGMRVPEMGEHDESEPRDPGRY